MRKPSSSQCVGYLFGLIEFVGALAALLDLTRSDPEASAPTWTAVCHEDALGTYGTAQKSVQI